MKNLSLAIQRFVNEEDGVTAIEYGLLAALVGVAVITAAALLGTNIASLFTSIANKLGGVKVP